MDINKAMLASDIASRASLSQKQAEAAIEAFTTLAREYAASGNKLAIRGFGTFSVKESPARMGRNPSTGEPVQIAARSTLKFKAYGQLP